MHNQMFVWRITYAFVVFKHCYHVVFEIEGSWVSGFVTDGIHYVEQTAV